jgi:hypothetical protein
MGPGLSEEKKAEEEAHNMEDGKAAYRGHQKVTS